MAKIENFLTAQWEKTQAYHHIFSHFSLIFQARKVKMKRFKSIKLMKWKIFVAIVKPVKLKRELKREPRKLTEKSIRDLKKVHKVHLNSHID